MQKLILITGDLAAGKSTLAEHISKRYQIPTFTKDKIKELLCDRIGFSNREENLNLSYLSFDLLYHIFECFADTGSSVVLESNFRQNELDRLKTAAEQTGYEIVTIFLTGDLHILHQRYLNRASSGTRHPAHLSQNLDSIDDFIAVSKANVPKFLYGTIIPINTTLPDSPFDLSCDERIVHALSSCSV
ncbi:MAG: AAA family ATPase [Clostridia bacterium]|nr:AAA family ATPase [Clostridia bacterium]